MPEREIRKKNENRIKENKKKNDFKKERITRVENGYSEAWKNGRKRRG